MSPHTHHYSYDYSTRVVHDFVDSYSRATSFVADMCFIDRRKFVQTLINLFAHNNRRFQFVRDTIKMVERADLYRDIARIPADDRPKYLTAVRTLIEDEWLDR